jgi:uncharacterized membrane-anchored protein YhcB (DUF1043 family)
MLLTIVMGGIVMILVVRWIKETKQVCTNQKELERTIQDFINSIEQSRQALAKRR